MNEDVLGGPSRNDPVVALISVSCCAYRKHVRLELIEVTGVLG